MADIRSMEILLEQLPPEIRDEVKKELITDDPVVRNIRYKSFVSKSKGIRNGKQRIRKRLKEIELVNYRTGWHYLKNSRIDVINQEVTHERITVDELIDHIRCNCYA